jgi:2'-5' RNA ligase
MISRLSRQYATPVFPPHITLIGNLVGSEKELSSQAQQLATRVRAFEITLTTIGYLDEYFRCLFIQAAETAALVEADRTARTTFHREQDAKFMPHLSLMYGDLNAETKRRIVVSIRGEFDIAFPVRSIHLFSTNGEPKHWYRVQEFELQGR